MTRLHAAGATLILGIVFGTMSLYGPWTHVHGRMRFFTDLVINPAVSWFGNIGGAVFFFTFGILLTVLALTGNMHTDD